MTYDGLPSYPPKTKWPDVARYEHAFLLRCEGFKYREIGDHLGVCLERARDMSRAFPRKWLNRAMRKTRFRWIREDEE